MLPQAARSRKKPQEVLRVQPKETCSAHIGGECCAKVMRKYRQTFERFVTALAQQFAKSSDS